MHYELISNNKSKLSLMETIFINRGFNIEDIEHYLNTTINDVIPPEKITNVKEGVKMLINHINNNDLIFMQIDSDCDGITSGAFFLNYLWNFFPTFVENNIIYDFHQGKEHGLILSEIPDNVKMVIAIDSSSFDYEVHHELKEKGIDILVIDHHDAPYYSLDACVINNQLDDNYNNKTLSGVGMAYKFCSYIDQIMNTDYADHGLDLVALGIIADMVSLKNFETRYLINKGLTNVHNPFISGMFERNNFSMKNKMTPTSVAFYMAPYVNSIIRSGTQEQKILLFESMLEYKAYDLIDSTKRGHKGELETKLEQSIRTCFNVKKKQDTDRDQSLEVMKELIERNNLTKNKVVIILLDSTNNITPNLGGLIANQLMSIYKQPVCILRDTGELWEGSCRAPRILDFKDLYEESGLLDYAAGHQQAFGIGIKKENIDKFIEYTNRKLEDIDFNVNYKVDFIYTPETLSSFDIIEVADLDFLWGQTIEEPLIAIEKLTINNQNLQVIGKNKNTIKITTQNKVELIKFNCSEEEISNLTSDSLGNIIINVIGTCSVNNYMGNTTAQILIKDFEVVKRNKYYF